MKLAEALSLRADAQKRVAQLRQRLIWNAKVQEGDAPSEEPEQLLQEVERVIAECLSLIRRINRTNSLSEIEPGVTLADALAQREILAQQQALYRDLAQAATVTQERVSRSEIRFRATVSVTAIQGRADTLARAYRALDVRIQEANWRIDLVE